MKSFTDYLWFETKDRRAIINITEEIANRVRQSGIREGLALVSAMHITASIWVNDEEEGLKADMMEWIEKLAPVNPNYRHHLTGEDNGDAHLKRSLLNHQCVLPITAGKLDLGPWEQIFYVEFDGQRRKKTIVKIIGE